MSEHMFIIARSHADGAGVDEAEHEMPFRHPLLTG